MRQLINRKQFMLENLEMCLNAHLSPDSIDDTLKQQPLSEQLHKLRTECCEAIQLLKCFQYEIPTADFKQLCQQNYSDLFCMKDRLNVLQASSGYNSMSEDALAFYEMLSYEMNRVEETLNVMGISSLAPHEQLPDFYRDARKALLWQQSLLLFAKLISKSADPAFVILLRAHVDAFMAAKRILQHELDFAEHLISTLFKLFDVPGEVQEDRFIINTLVCLNFNSSDAYHYCRERIEMELIECNGSKRKLEALNWHLKELTQMLPVSGLALFPAYPELKVLLLDLLRAEITYLDFPTPCAENTGMETKKVEKIRLQLSQRIFAMLIHTMITMDVIQLKNLKAKRAFTEFLSDHFTTAGSEGIDPECFRRRYREKHTASSETLVALLEKMIAFIKREYMDV